MATFTRTVRQLIVDALVDVEAVAAGETPEAEDISLGLARLNNMVDGLGAERLALHRVQRITKTLTANDADYTIGVGGEVATAWPEWIVRSGYIPVAASTQERPVVVFTDADWAAISNKSLTSLPQALWYDRAFPLGTLYPWPVPSEAGTLVLYLPVAISEFGDETDLDTEIALPPGYREMLTSNLTVRLGPAFGHSVPEATRMIAVSSARKIKQANSQPLRLRTVNRPGRRRYTYGDFLGGQ